MCKNTWTNSNIGNNRFPQWSSNITIMIKKCTNINLTSLLKSLGNRTLNFEIYMLSEKSSHEHFLIKLRPQKDLKLTPDKLMTDKFLCVAGQECNFLLLNYLLQTMNFVIIILYLHIHSRWTSNLQGSNEELYT